MPLNLEAYTNPNPAESWLREAIEDWKLDRETGGGDPGVAYRFQKLTESNPDEALKLIVSLADKAKTEKDKVDVAETLEWLLQYHGQEYWEILNDLCREKESMKEVMACVWGASLPPELKRKVEMWR